jgi:hypothetical protein
MSRDISDHQTSPEKDEGGLTVPLISIAFLNTHSSSSSAHSGLCSSLHTGQGINFFAGSLGTRIHLFRSDASLAAVNLGPVPGVTSRPEEGPA